MGQAISLNCGAGSRQLFNAATSGEVQTLQEALVHRPELLDATVSGGMNVVHIAAGKGNKDLLKGIVEALQHQPSVQAIPGTAFDMKLQTVKNMDSSRHLREALNLRTHAGHTPLMLAAKNGHVQCVQYLIDSGADVFRVDKSHSRSVLHYAVASGSDKVVKYLVSENTVMHTDDGLQSLRWIQVKDISGQCRFIDSRAENGLTALHIAAAKGYLKIVKLLLEAGASLMVRTVDMEMPSPHSVPNGSTPLHLAAQKGLVSIVQIMLQTHADAMGTWSNGTEGGRRGWEQSNRIDLRSVANANRQLPYHVAWQRGFRQTAQILNPTIAIDIALENVRELDEGYGPQKLSTLAAYCLRKNLLDWLEEHKVQLEEAKKAREQRAAAQRVIMQQKRKEALKLHSNQSVDDSLQAAAERLVSEADKGHTFSLSSSGKRPQPKRHLSQSSGRVRGELPQMETIPSVGNSLHASGSSEGLPRPEDTARELQDAVAPGVDATVNDTSSASSAQDSQPSKISKRSNFYSASLRLRSSMKKLRPSRPPPPPPPGESGSSERAGSRSERVGSRSERAGSRTTPQHRRQVSWEDSEETGELARRQSGSPPVVVNCLGTPFRSPFAQASVSVDPGEEDEEREQARPSQLTTHPSGVGLADPPGGFMSRQSSKKLINSRSRKGSFGLGSLGSGSFTNGGMAASRSKSRRLSTDGRDFSRAASIPGFDNNLDDDDDCGICLEEPVNVAVCECQHKLCVDCAIKLCQIAKKPPLCPFCRITINAFEGLAKTG